MENKSLDAIPQDEVEKLLERLEEDEDVQAVFHNMAS
jgi:transcriptional/translational regulatory protein YebC/TACO1